MRTLFVLSLLLITTPAARAAFLFGNSGTQPQSLVLNGSLALYTFTSGNWAGYSQGWWSAGTSNDDTNDNYYTGDGEFSLNNFFTFAIPVEFGTVTSAKLVLTRYASDSLPVTYSLYDVSTNPIALNQNAGTNAAIFNDLGSGVLYGSIGVSDYLLPDPLEITLNVAALAAIQASEGGLFSIGGTLSPVQEIPEPGAFTLLALGALALGLARRRAIG